MNYIQVKQVEKKTTRKSQIKWKKIKNTDRNKKVRKYKNIQLTEKDGTAEKTNKNQNSSLEKIVE